MTFTISASVSSHRPRSRAAEVRAGRGEVARAQLPDRAPVLLVERLELDHLGVEAPRQHASGSCTKATPPDIPAAKLRPVGPSTSTVPPVMYSQPWSPTPSTTAVAPELRTQKRSPTWPLMKAAPDVAP